MNKEAVVQELNGQVVKLLELFQRKEKLIETIKKAKKEMEELTSMIKNADGVIQTLQFMVQSDGFTNLGAVKQGRQPVEVPGHTNLNEVSKTLKGQ